MKFGYDMTSQIRDLLSTFRDMVNSAIRICLEEGIRGRLRLRDRIYREFKQRYGVVSSFPYSVAEVAWSIAKKHRKWQRNPVAKRLMLKVDSQNYSLSKGILSLPFAKGARVLIPLRYGKFQLSYLKDPLLKSRSLTLTDSAVIITFAKVVKEKIPLRIVGYDLNEKSIVGSDGSRLDLSEVARLHTEYGVRRADFAARHPHDRRLMKEFASSSREKERTKQFLHRVACQVVNKAKKNQEGIILEDLGGVRLKRRKGDGSGPDSRRRIALWPFGQLQGYIEYKARWEGIPVDYVSAAWTSKTCNVCGRINRKLKVTQREWRCPCGAILDRDLNAAVNIERRGKIPCLGMVRPGARGTDEAVKGNPTPPVILRAEALKLTRA